MDKYEKLLKQFDKLYNALEKIAPYLEDLDDDSLETAKTVLRDAELVEVWQKYVRRFHVCDLEPERLLDIEERRQIEESVKGVARNIIGGKELEEYEKSILLEAVDIKVTEQEKKYYNKCVEKLRKAAEERFGKGICAYDLAFRGRRVCRLLNLGAPEIIINHEAQTLAAAMLLYQYGITREVVDNRIRLRLEMLEMMDEEELEEEILLEQ